MKTVEVSGRTLEEAVEAAALELGVSKDQIEHEIVEEGSKGFMGLGQTPTIVKAWAIEPIPEPEPIAVPVIEVAEPEQVQTSGNSNEYAQAAMEVLSVILQAMNLDAKPSLKSADPEYIYLDIVGTDLAILIGKHGQTLDALQYLLQIAASKKVHSDARIVLDAEGYREKHNKMLEKKALEYADAVKQQQREAVLDPQPARDRRIIHMTLVDHPDVYTYSEGFGDGRHVVISPKR